MFNLSNITNNIFFTLKIKTKDFNDIIKEPELLEKLRKLTLSPGSGMNYELDHIESRSKCRKVNAHAILAYRSDELVAWALYSEEQTDFYFERVLGFNPVNDGILFEVYVHPNHRRQGIASKLLNTAKRLAGSKKLCVCPWDRNSHQFFNNFKHLDYKAL